MFTPSPTSLSPSTITSSTLMPTRSLSVGDSPSCLSCLVGLCTSSAQCTAATALGNSTSTESPAISSSRPRWVRIDGSITSARSAFQARRVSTSFRSIRRDQSTTSANAIAARRR
jgi:hypothetical protein